ncbi:uncharacterized protein JCM10292_004023 [Rhodotorula paludigena]|uniref:uncharacterized protein n=1 Tax=Rhodotorula paludigena TaxID=86838 RepID=UPI00317E020D
MVFAPGDKYPDVLPGIDREFIGYGLNKPDPQWPGGAKVAVSFVFNLPYGAERSLENGDEGGETMFPDIPIRVQPKGKRFEMLESAYNYGTREGLPRILRLFAKYNRKATWNVCTQGLAKMPYWVKPLVASPHEISCASKRYIDYLRVEPEVEDAHVQEAIDTLQSLTGDKTLPRGWNIDRCSNISPLLYTRAHADRGFPQPYTSDSTADELPYWVPSPLVFDGKEDKGLLVVPMSLDTGDFRFLDSGSGWASPKHYFEYLCDTFDVLHAEGSAGEPKMMTIQLHPHIIGHGGRLYWLEEFLKYLEGKGADAWVARRDEIADHWAKRFPYDPKTAMGLAKHPECW